jgi:hypothetical protein
MKCKVNFTIFELIKIVVEINGSAIIIEENGEPVIVRRMLHWGTILVCSAIVINSNIDWCKLTKTVSMLIDSLFGYLEYLKQFIEDYL